MKSFFKRILHDIDWLTNNPIYQLFVSIALVGVSVYDSVKVIIQDVGSLHFKKEHFVILIGVLMLINSINNLFKGVKKLDQSVEILEETAVKEERER